MESNSHDRMDIGEDGSSLSLAMESGVGGVVPVPRNKLNFP